MWYSTHIQLQDVWQTTWPFWIIYALIQPFFCVFELWYRELSRDERPTLTADAARRLDAWIESTARGESGESQKIHLEVFL